jgi:hypothetical protein
MNEHADDLKLLEKITNELMEEFEIYAPPVPIETMLQKPNEGMWDEVDINQLSGSFLSIKDPFSPRASLARMLVRHVAGSDWGRERNLIEILRKDEELIHAFARMIIMPAEMVLGLRSGERNPTIIKMKFEVPEDDARQRLLELL